MKPDEKARLEAELLRYENELKKCDGLIDAKFEHWLRCKIEETKMILGIPTPEHPVPLDTILYFKKTD